MNYVNKGNCLIGLNAAAPGMRDTCADKCVLREAACVAGSKVQQVKVCRIDLVDGPIVAAFIVDRQAELTLVGKAVSAAQAIAGGV